MWRDERLQVGKLRTNNYAEPRATAARILIAALPSCAAAVRRIAPALRWRECLCSPDWQQLRASRAQSSTPCIQTRSRSVECWGTPNFRFLLIIDMRLWCVLHNVFHNQHISWQSLHCRARRSFEFQETPCHTTNDRSQRVTWRDQQRIDRLFHSRFAGSQKLLHV